MIKTWAVAICLGVVLLGTAVSALAQQGFAPEQGTAFVSECAASGGDPTLCQCVWNGVESRMTPDEYAAFDTALRTQQLHGSMAKFELIIGECNGTSRVTASNSEAYPGHTSTNFVESCVGGGVAQPICACTMNNLEREMPLQTFVELDRMMEWGRGAQHPAYPNFVRIVQQCGATVAK